MTQAIQTAQAAKPISVSERLLHAVLFEVLLLLTQWVIFIFVAKADSASSLLLAVAISLTAMSWNYLFNWLFDRWQGPNRLARSWRMRLLHAVLFELVLIVAAGLLTLALIDAGPWLAFGISMAVSLWALVFAFGYNWLFDLLRSRWYGPYPERSGH